MAEIRTIAIFIILFMLPLQMSAVELHERILELKPSVHKQFYYTTQSGAASARAVLQFARQCHHEAEGCPDTFFVTDDETCVTPPLSYDTYCK